MLLSEIHGKDIFYTTKYRYLYHMTDGHGFSYSVNGDALKPLRQNYVSTTYNPDMHGVYGYQHYDFKFILDGKKLVETYGGFKHTHRIRVGNQMESLNESEIGINTKEISPLRDYTVGMVLLFDLFTEKGIRWLLYDRNDQKSFLDSPKTATTRSIEALYTFAVEWRKPIWFNEGKTLRPPTLKEVRFLKEMFRIHKEGGNYQKALLELVQRYRIVDWDKRVLDRDIIERQQSTPKLVKLLNTYYQKRKYNRVDPDKVRDLIGKCLDILHYGGNAKATIMDAIERAGLFHPTTQAVQWGGILMDLVRGEIETALEHIEYTANHNRRLVQRYDAHDPYMGLHTGTDFGSP